MPSDYSHSYHPSTRVRRAAVRGMGRLDVDGSHERLAAALQDCSPSVAKAARDAMLSSHHLLLAQRLWWQ
jgi:hypothetical protein